jgi:hypothetical protein
MRRVTVEERRARLARRHHLDPASRAEDVTQVARSLVALHSSDPATVFLAAAARLTDGEVTAIEDALYQERSLVRLLAMRRTMWVVPVEAVPVVRSACSDAVAKRERRRLVKLLQDTGIAEDGEGWLASVQEETLAALTRRGAAFGAELSKDVPDLRTKYEYAPDKPYGGTQSVTTQVLNGLSMAGRIVRGRPRGGWHSSQYQWAPVESWLPEGIPEMDRDEAQVSLLKTWLGSFGPATAADMKWWTGLTMGEVKRALAVIDPVEVDLGGETGETGLVLPDDLGPVPSPEPWVALLPGLDPTAMGWVQRDWYLGDHRDPLFDRSGNIGPSVWCDGRIVGGWAQRKAGRDADGDGEIVFRLLEDIGSEATAAVEKQAERLADWIGDVRITPRFRTPLERELTA